MKHVLEFPALYQLYQEAGGFFGARIAAIRDYLAIPPRARVIDIGCGPGFIVRHLPDSIDYVGFDIDAPSITYARRHFGAQGRFEARLFDAAAAAEFGPADIVMMNGVMHHIGDAELLATLRVIGTALKPGGVLFTLDGCSTRIAAPMSATVPATKTCCGRSSPVSTCISARIARACPILSQSE